MGSGVTPRPEGSRDPDPLHVTPELLADLQAGLLDDATAARVRGYARTDPDTARMLAELDAVRSELARLGSPEHDTKSAPDVPEAVTARIAAALRAAPPAAASARGHALSRPRLRSGQWVAFAVGLSAVVVSAVLGALVLASEPGPVFPSGPTAAQITVDRHPAGFPLNDDELRAMLSPPHDLGLLTDPQRLASCVAGLGHSPALPVLGGRVHEVFGQPAVVLLVPSGRPDEIRAVAVAPTCTAAHTGLLAETVLPTR
ncbi:hypothetical protein [Mycolicibacterium sp.]